MRYAICGRALAAVLALSTLPMCTGYAAGRAGTVKLEACADTYVEGGTGKDTNFGAEGILLAKRQTQKLTQNKNDHTIFIKFDLSQLTAEDAESMETAEVVLKNADDKACEASVYATDMTDWEEDTLTASTAEYEAYTDIEENYEHIADLAVEASAAARIDVTDYVTSLLEDDKKGFTIVILGETSSSVTARKTLKIVSREAETDGPQLVITKKTAPLPSDFENTSLALSEVGYVRPDDRDTSFPGSLYIKAGTRVGVVKIDLSAVAATDFKKAILTLYTEASELKSAVTTIEAYKMSSDWSQDTITYNNMPARGELCGTFRTQEGQWSRLDVTDYAKAEIENGSTEISLMLVQNAAVGRNMIISSTDSAENASRLKIYYPSGDKNVAELTGGSWELSGAKYSDGVLALSGDGAQALSKSFRESAEEYKFLVKAPVRVHEGAAAEAALAADGRVVRLMRAAEKDGSVTVYINTSTDGAAEPQTAYEKSFAAGEEILLEAVYEGGNVSYYINGIAAGTAAFAGIEIFERLGLYADGGAAEFSGVELLAVNIYSGNRSFSAVGAGEISVDSPESVRVPFSTEISLGELYGRVSINGDRVDDSRLAVTSDGKTLAVAPDANGFEAYSKNTLEIDMSTVRDIFGETAAEQLFKTSFSVTGWELSASAVTAERADGAAAAAVRIKNNTDGERNVCILLARAVGSEDLYMFAERAVKRVSVGAGAQLDESISLNAVPDGGFMKLFVYDGDTYEPILRVPYVFGN